LAPATATDRQGFVLVVNVEFNVAVSALAVPRVSTSFGHLYLTTPLTRGSTLKIKYKIADESTIHESGRPW